MRINWYQELPIHTAFVYAMAFDSPLQPRNSMNSCSCANTLLLDHLPFTSNDLILSKYYSSLQCAMQRLSKLHAAMLCSVPTTKSYWFSGEPLSIGRELQLKKLFPDISKTVKIFLPFWAFYCLFWLLTSLKKFTKHKSQDCADLRQLALGLWVANGSKALIK